MNTLNILLVEDNEGDILLTTETLNEDADIGRLDVVRDGKAAIEYLENLDGNKGGVDLVLLDLNLPKLNGLEVLKFIKKNKKYNRLPVVILTTSSSQSDILLCYQNYANCYLIKPYDANDFAEVLTRLKYLWSQVVALPDKHS